MKHFFYPKRIRNIIASGLTLAIFAASSVTAPAASDRRLMGELTIAGASPVSVNGERAFSGRSVSSASVVATSGESSAIISLGQVGRIELAPNSSLSLDFDDKTISGSLGEGSVRISSAPGVAVRLAAKNGEITNEASELNVFSVAPSGEIVAENGTIYLNDGKTVTQVGGQTTGQTTDDKMLSVYLPVAIIAGAVATVIIVAAASGDDDDTSTPNPSPIR